jgi:hypothetical protein
VTSSLLGKRRRGLAMAGVLLYAAPASLTAPLTPVASVAVLLPCVLVLGLACAWRTRTDTGRLRERLSRTALAWGAVVTLTAAWDLVAWLSQPAYDVASADHPTVSVLLDPLTGSPLPRFLLWCCWLYAGYRLVRR